jgi:Zn finger protein HypA/HybF involved in hydrogenase expression
MTKLNEVEFYIDCGTKKVKAELKCEQCDKIFTKHTEVENDDGVIVECPYCDNKKVKLVDSG